MPVYDTFIKDFIQRLCLPKDWLLRQINIMALRTKLVQWTYNKILINHIMKQIIPIILIAIIIAFCCAVILAAIQEQQEEIENQKVKIEILDQLQAKFHRTTPATSSYRNLYPLLKKRDRINYLWVDNGVAK
jgi:hypothetical protein